MLAAVDTIAKGIAEEAKQCNQIRTQTETATTPNCSKPLLIHVPFCFWPSFCLLLLCVLLLQKFSYKSVPPIVSDNSASFS
jgi:hypothetical protein